MITRRRKVEQNKTVTKNSPAAPVISSRPTTRSTVKKINGKTTTISKPTIQKSKNNLNATVESVKKKLLFCDAPPPQELDDLSKGFTSAKVSVLRMSTEDIATAIGEPVKKKPQPKSTKQKKVVSIVLKKTIEDTKIKLLTQKGAISDNKSPTAIRKNLRSNNKPTNLKKSPKESNKFNEIHKKVANKKCCLINVRRLSQKEISDAISGNTKPIKKREPRKKKIDIEEENKKVADAIKEGILKLASSSSPSTEIRQRHTPIYKSKVQQKAGELKTNPIGSVPPSSEIATNNSAAPIASNNNNHIFDYFSNSQEFSDDEDNVEKNEMKRVIEKLCREKKVIIKHKPGRKPLAAGGGGGGKIKTKLAGITKPKSTMQGKRKNMIVERQLRTLKENLQSSLIQQQKILHQNKPIVQKSPVDLLSSSSECDVNLDNTGLSLLEIATSMPIQKNQEEKTVVQKLPMIKYFNDLSAVHSEISMLSPIVATNKTSLGGINNTNLTSKPKRLSLIEKNKILKMLNMPVSQSTPIRFNSTLIQTENVNKELHEQQSSSSPRQQEVHGNQSPWRVETEDIRKVLYLTGPTINKPKTVTSKVIITSVEKLSPIQQLPVAAKAATADLDSTVKSAAPPIQIPIRLTFSHHEETPQILSDTTIGLSNIENCDPEDTPLILSSPLKPLMERPVGRSPLKDLSIGVGYNSGNILTSAIKSKSNYYPESPLIRTYQNSKLQSPNKTFNVPPLPIETTKSLSKPKLPDLFGFESDIDDEPSIESNESISHIRTPQKKLIKQKNQKFKETLRQNLFVAPAAVKTIKKNPQTKKLFKDSTMSNNELQSKKIPEIISDQVYKLNNKQMASKSTEISNNEEELQLFQPLWPEKHGTNRKSYTRTPKRKYHVSDSEDESDQESHRSSPHKNKKKRVALSRKQLEKDKIDNELNKFATEFNSMCEEIDKYEMPVEVIGNSSGGSV